MKEWLMENDLERFRDINFSSSKQVLELFKILKIPTKVKDKLKSIGKDIIYKDTVGKAHVSRYIKKFPFLKLYINFKTYQKASTAFGEQFLIKFQNPVTGRIHSSFYPILATGRISSSRPNNQQLPRGAEVRAAFEPKDGWSFVCTDYSSQELYVMADVFNEPQMLDTLARGEDLHNFAAKNMFGENYNRGHRTKAKSLNYGIPYGMSKFKLAGDFNISESEADSIINSWFGVFTGFKATFPTVQKKAVADGYVRVNTVSNRICLNDQNELYEFAKKEISRLKRLKTNGKEDKLIPRKYWSTYFSLKSRFERKAVNSKIQGTAADMGKLAGIYMLNWIKSKNYQSKVKIILFVHDEYIVSCVTSLTAEVEIAAQKSMEEAAAAFCKKIQIPAIPEVARHWVH
tara:strand:+ start:4385 stop:5590 length:1206 start_codon:yes stop_codon:yes gene_type:complete